MIGKQQPNWAERSRIMHRVWGSVDMMVRGIGDVEAWRDICDAVNCVEALAEMGKLQSEPYTALVDAAKAGMVAARGCEPSRMAMVPEHLTALRNIAQAYDDALARFASSTLAEARTRVVMGIARQRQQRGVTVVD